MIRTFMRGFIWSALCVTLGIGLGAVAQAQNNLAASPGLNLIDTTDFSVLGPNTGYWFANFGNPVAVTGAATNSFEASNLPYWIHLDADPAHTGMDDSGVIADGTGYTGYSFEDVSDSTGGQPGWNVLTLPDGTTGLSGAAVDADNGPNNVDNWIKMRFLPGAPSTATFWVVTDNWGSAAINADPLKRLRVRTKDLDAGFNDVGDFDQVDSDPGEPLPNNGIADAYAFTLTNIIPGDGLVVRITSADDGQSHGSIGGLMFRPIPEPSSIALLLLGAAGAGWMTIRRRG